MQLTQKELSPYLYYKLMMSNQDVYNGMPFELIGIANKTTIVLYGDWSGGTHNTFGNSQYGIASWKPILWPLSCLTKPIEHNGERFVPIEKLSKILYDKEPESFDDVKNAAYWLGAITSSSILNMPYWLCEKLFEYHLDVFGLIEKGLAINKSELKE